MNAPFNEGVCRVVALESFFCPIPAFEPFHGRFETAIYERTPRDSLETLHERVKDAHIVIITTFPLTSSTLSSSVTPKLKAVMIMSVGTDCVDLEACKKRGIRVFNCAGANTDSVAEHAVGLYFGVRRRIVDLHERTLRDEWASQGTLLGVARRQSGQGPLSLKDEKVGIIGWGAIGQRIAQLCTSLGMTVQVSARKCPEIPMSHGNAPRIPFQDILRQSTVLFVCVPLNADTVNLLTEEEFSLMGPHTVVVNISRGGVVNEDDLLGALKTQQVAGAATDVFRVEPASPSNSALLRHLQCNDADECSPLVLSPHLAWFSKATVQNLQRMVKDNIEGWILGHPPSHSLVA